MSHSFARLFASRLLSACVLLAALWATPSIAQLMSAEEVRRLEDAAVTVREVEGLVPAQADSFNGLLSLRQRVELSRNDLRELVAGVAERAAQAEARRAALGPAPAAGQPAESGPQAFERRRVEGLVTEVQTQLRAARATLLTAEQLWDDITDRRRKLFSSRLFDHKDSFLSPAFWGEVGGQAIPQLSRRIGRQWAEISAGVSARGGWPILAGLIAFMAIVAGALVLLHRWLAKKRALSAPEFAERPSQAAIVSRAAIILLMRSLPFALAAGALAFAVTRFDIVPNDVQDFLVGVAGALFVFGLGTGATEAVFAPRAPAYRVLVCDDATARRAVGLLRALLLIYLGALILHGVEQLLSVLVSLTIATTGVMALAMVLVTALKLAGAPPVAQEAGTPGLVRAPLHLLRPILWLVSLAIIAALLFGYISLAGFIAGRAVATAVILCLALLAYLAIETVFHDAIAPNTSGNARIAATLGLNPATVDLVGTIIAGALRVITVVLTVLILFSPWGIEFGNKNPFDDAFFGVRFGDVRGWLGAAGVAVVLFAVGLLGTRLFVAWLDNRLLPRTALDTGMRHSISTIAGYVGFAVALAIALGQAGVQLQNIALVAGALSVGIGFGLQQVVSNFVAGLIVLAERPIRVGDVVVVKGEEGKVKRISVRSTELSLGERSTLIVPNADFIASIVKNRSLTDPTQRVKIVLLLAHDADLQAAFRILLDAAMAHKNVLQAPPPNVHITKVTDVGTEIELKFIADHLDNMDLARTVVIYTALQRFKEAGIVLAKA